MLGLRNVVEGFAVPVLLLKFQLLSQMPPSINRRSDTSRRVIRESKSGEARDRALPRVPIQLSNGDDVTPFLGDQHPLIKQIVEALCPRFAPGGLLLYLGDTATKFKHLEADALQVMGIRLDPSAKMPDVVVHDAKRNWLILIEAVATGGVIDGKRRNELKQLFKNSKAGLVFVTAFDSRRTMQSALSQISWETEVWVADAPDHLIHFNGERFLGPYPD